jgi:hypothetical protein
LLFLLLLLLLLVLLLLLLLLVVVVLLLLDISQYGLLLLLDILGVLLFHLHNLLQRIGLDQWTAGKLLHGELLESGKQMWLIEVSK